MKNTSGLTRQERRAKRAEKIASRLATLPRYWVFIRKPGSKYTKLVSSSIGFAKSSKFRQQDGTLSSRETIYAVTKVA